MRSPAFKPSHRYVVSGWKSLVRGLLAEGESYERFDAGTSSFEHVTYCH